MPGPQPGQRFGGRRAGTPNRDTQRVFEILDKLGVDPIEGMARIAIGDVPCFECVEPHMTQIRTVVGLEEGQEQVPLPAADPGCPRCKGKGKEQVSLDLRANMHRQLAGYTYPARRAVEVSGPEGGPIEHRIKRADSIMQLLNPEDSPPPTDVAETGATPS